MSRIHTAVACAVGALVLACWAPRTQAQTGDVVTGNTLPSDTRKLSFHVPGIVRLLNVKEGQLVKAGDVLAVQDDRQDQVELDGLKLDAESNVEIEAAEVGAKAKAVELDRVKKIYDSGGGNDWEYDKAQYEYDHAKLEVQNAQLQSQLKKCKAQKQEIEVEQMRLRSPIDGVVEKIDAKEGEMAAVEADRPAMVIVKNDPLWVEFHVPSGVARHVEAGQVVKVSYIDAQVWEPATVIFRDPVADAASGTQLIRLELANPEGRSAGLQVKIQLSPVSGVADRAGP